MSIPPPEEVAEALVEEMNDNDKLAQFPDLLIERITSAIKAAVEAETEACAKICDDEDGHIHWSGTDHNVRVRQDALKEAAAAIRSRSEKP